MTSLPYSALVLLTSATLGLTSPVLAASDHAHKHEHEHEHAAGDAEQIHKGYFEDSQVQPRSLSDWAGDWQSVYPYLVDGTLDPVMEKKAETSDRSAADYRAYYEVGYATDVDALRIDGEVVTFKTDGAETRATYVPDGYEILTYEKGNRGVRYIYRKTDGDAAAPGFIQFSDHRIAPETVGHFHLYWGDDRAAVLHELTNWPTYYPAGLDGADILHEQLAH